MTVIETEAALVLAEGDPGLGRKLAVEALELERTRDIPNWLADVTWWVGRVFGADAVGGEEELDRARERLEAVHWRHALHEPDLLRQAVAG
jgi:hypothetical protein